MCRLKVTKELCPLNSILDSWLKPGLGENCYKGHYWKENDKIWIQISF